MKSVLLTSLPKYELVAPPAAIGIIQGVAKTHGLHTEVFDFNVYLNQHLTKDEWQQLDNWLIFLQKDISKELKDKIISLWDKGIAEKMPASCEFLLMSVFSYWSLYIARLVIEHEAKKITPYKLIVGGNGVSSKFPDTGQYFKDWNTKNKYVDHLILGEGENPLSTLWSHGKVHYDDNNLDTFPFPTYANFDFPSYEEKKVYITGSRGCVRKCTFCDIQNIWPKFRFRSANNIVEEIKKHYYEHGITRFDFTDSLINGSTSNFYKFNSLLAEEKAKNSDLKDVGYLGQAICRPRNQMLPSHYEAMYHAGCRQLTIGIESFSESVRNHMKKKFSDADIEYHLEQCGYWQIPNVFLMISCYPTETLEDHNKNVSDLRKYQKYSKSGVIEFMRWGTTMHIAPDTPIATKEMVKDLGLITPSGQDIFYEPGTSYTWKCKSNPSLDLKERIRRRLELHKVTTELGYLQPDARNELTTILKMSEFINEN